MKKYNIYRNLHNNLLSIQDKVTKLVVGHCESVLLRNTSFKVNEAGIKRIRKNKRKEVIAVVMGDIRELFAYKPYKGRTVIADVVWTCSIRDREVIGWTGTRVPKEIVFDSDFDVVTFNAYKNKSFVYQESGKKAESAKWCYITHGGLIITKGVYNEKSK